MSTSDRRRSRRIEMKLPIVVRYRDEAGGLAVLHATTANIGTDGCYFEIDGPRLDVGAQLNLELTLPPADGVSAFEGKATAMCDVVRVDERHGGRRGIAGRFRTALQLRY